MKPRVLFDIGVFFLLFMSSNLFAFQTRIVQQNESLWHVAKSIRPDERFSVAQVMLAIHKLNPHAFSNGDIRHLNAGASIKIPESDDISSIEPRLVGQMLSKLHTNKRIHSQVSQQTKKLSSDQVKSKDSVSVKTDKLISDKGKKEDDKLTTGAPRDISVESKVNTEIIQDRQSQGEKQTSILSKATNSEKNDGELTAKNLSTKRLGDRQDLTDLQKKQLQILDKQNMSGYLC